jgi:hypothetical protein
MSEAKMRNVWTKRASKMVLIVPLALIGLAVFGLIVMWLWNALMPSLLGWHRITFWQALGIFVLSKILFGGFRGRGHGMHGRRRMMERWEQMTPEEREKFRKGLQGCCGGSRARNESDAAHGAHTQA